MNNAPKLWDLKSLYEFVAKRECQMKTTDGRYVPSRPCGYYSLGSRLSIAWKVFTGKADAVVWSDGQ